MGFFDIKGTVKPLTGLSQFAKKPHTLLVPEIQVEASDRYRGIHFNDLEACIGCGNCSTICMNKAIDMVPVEGIEGKKGDSGLRPRIDHGRCCWCALCVEVCPTGSLRLTKDYIFVSENPEDFLFLPGVDNPDGGERSSFVSTPQTTLTELKRVPMPELEGEERVKSFAEVVLGYTEEEARKEASRCLSCGLCTEACPDHMHIPEYINAIAAGNDEDAIRIIYDNNPLPEMCGKVCTRRCEEVCAITKRGEPVAIRWLKRYAIERAETADILYEIVNPEIKPKNGYKVGIIGAGPAGLTAGYYLTLKGFDVTIFEATNKAGGMITWGIPKYRFPVDSLYKQIEYMEKVGVKIKYNTRVGKDITFDEIYNNFDAVFIGVGFQVGWKLGIEGEDLEGSIEAINFLCEVNNVFLKDENGNFVRDEKGNVIKITDTKSIADIGDKVVVIGGGNVAIDAARVARRLGADVTILYRRRIKDMPADWEEIEGAEAEGVKIIPQGIPVKIIGDEKGHVKKLVYLKAEMVPDPKGGRPRPQPIEGSETEIEVTAVIAAIGQGADYSFLPEKYLEKIKIERGRIVTNEWRQTGDPKVFAGGDSVNRTADAISAIADGFRAVKGIEKLLLNKE